MWLIGAAMSLESMRRGFVGGSMLALFVIKEFGLEKQAVPTLAFMRYYLDIEEKLIPNIPPFLAAVFFAFLDYHDSAVLYLEILDILSEQQRPRSCEYYWKKES